MARNIEEAWAEYEAFLEAHAPTAFANLAPGASDAALATLEQELQQPLPRDLCTLLRLRDGQVKLGRACAFPGLRFLSCKRIAEEWLSWARFRDNETEDGLGMLDSHASALDPGVQDVYTHPGWIPLLKLGDRSDYIGVDTVPAEGGILGQVINFGRDEDQHFVASPSLAELIDFSLEELRKAMEGCSLKLDKLNGLALLSRAAEARREASQDGSS